MLGRLSTLGGAGLLLVLLSGGAPAFAAGGDQGACTTWMGLVGDNPPGRVHTAPEVAAQCDDATFVVLSHEYARDHDSVFFKPLPNMTNMTVVLRDADPASFRMSSRCRGLAIDQQHVFQYGKIREGVTPVQLETGVQPCW